MLPSYLQDVILLNHQPASIFRHILSRPKSRRNIGKLC